MLNAEHQACHEPISPIRQHEFPVVPPVARREAATLAGHRAPAAVDTRARPPPEATDAPGAHDIQPPRSDIPAADNMPWRNGRPGPVERSRARSDALIADDMKLRHREGWEGRQYTIVRRHEQDAGVPGIDCAEVGSHRAVRARRSNRQFLHRWRRRRRRRRRETMLSCPNRLRHAPCPTPRAFPIVTPRFAERRSLSSQTLARFRRGRCLLTMIRPCAHRRLPLSFATTAKPGQRWFAPLVTRVRKFVPALSAASRRRTSQARHRLRSK
jgi:hypothetical protein